MFATYNANVKLYASSRTNKKNFLSFPRRQNYLPHAPHHGRHGSRENSKQNMFYFHNCSSWCSKYKCKYSALSCQTLKLQNTKKTNFPSKLPPRLSRHAAQSVTRSLLHNYQSNKSNRIVFFEIAGPNGNITLNGYACSVKPRRACAFVPHFHLIILQAYLGALSCNWILRRRFKSLGTYCCTHVRSHHHYHHKKLLIYFKTL